jgi:hypothetical protein
VSDADELEAVLLQAAGVHRPSSMDISPILALIEEGYDIDRDIVPAIKRMALAAKGPISSWRFFVPGIKQARIQAAVGASTEQETTLDGDFADGPRPVWWIRGSDPRYPSLAARWAKERPSTFGPKPPAPIMSKYFKGEGWAFPAHWVGDPPPSR